MYRKFWRVAWMVVVESKFGSELSLGFTMWHVTFCDTKSVWVFSHVQQRTVKHYNCWTYYTSLPNHEDPGHHGRGLGTREAATDFSRASDHIWCPRLGPTPPKFLRGLLANLIQYFWDKNDIWAGAELRVECSCILRLGNGPVFIGINQEYWIHP